MHEFVDWYYINLIVLSLGQGKQSLHGVYIPFNNAGRSIWNKLLCKIPTWAKLSLFLFKLDIKYLLLDSVGFYGIRDDKGTSTGLSLAILGVWGPFISCK